MSLERFKTAQEDRTSGFETALAELNAGRKNSHWIWYVFPQLASLGRSSTARFYGLTNLEEACGYLLDSQLRRRLLLVTEAVHRHLAGGTPMLTLMGSETDCFKLSSSLTLFGYAAKKLQMSVADEVARELEKLISLSEEVLAVAKAQGFPHCVHTLEAVEPAQKA